MERFLWVKRCYVCGGRWLVAATRRPRDGPAVGISRRSVVSEVRADVSGLICVFESAILGRCFDGLTLA